MDREYRDRILSRCDVQQDWSIRIGSPVSLKMGMQYEIFPVDARLCLTETMFEPKSTPDDRS